MRHRYQILALPIVYKADNTATIPGSTHNMPSRELIPLSDSSLDWKILIIDTLPQLGSQILLTPNS